MKLDNILKESPEVGEKTFRKAIFKFRHNVDSNDPQTVLASIRGILKFNQNLNDSEKQRQIEKIVKKTITKIPLASFLYATEMINKRFVEGEHAIKKDPELWRKYKEKVGTKKPAKYRS